MEELSFTELRAAGDLTGNKRLRPPGREGRPQGHVEGAVNGRV